MATLSWRHHTLIQALLSRGPLKEEDFRSIFLQINGKTSGSRKQQEQRLFVDYLGKINSELSYVQLELRACINQYDGHVYYGVVNNVSDDQSKLGTKYTVPQIAFYKGIVEAITQDAEAEGLIFSIDALYISLEKQVPGATDSQSQRAAVKIPAAFRNFTMSQKEKTMEQLIKDQWLCSTPEGKIGIGLRSFLDLRSWFRSNEVPACVVCNEAAIKAQLCPNGACNIRLHLYCAKKKFSGKRVERVCPVCGTQWLGSSVKAEILEEMNDPNGSQNSQPQWLGSTVKAEIAEEMNDTNGPQNSQPLQRSVKRSRRSQGEANGGTAGYGSSQARGGPSYTKRVTRSSTRLG